MIEVNNIYKSFENSDVLKGIDTSFYRGKTNLIIGQSGSGKTVLLKCLLGLYEVDSGEIIYDGLSSKNMNIDEKLEISRQMGMVFQGSALFDSMSAQVLIAKDGKVFFNKSYGFKTYENNESWEDKEGKEAFWHSSRFNW